MVGEEGRTGSPQVQVEADLAEWNKTWHKLAGVASAPWRNEELEEDDLEALPPPTPGEMRRAARRFHPYTGVGSDLFRPLWFGWLSDPLLSRVAALLTEVERAGRWPGQVMTVLMHLIPKEGGGRRPIGLLASLVRWWEKLRAPMIQRWRAEHARPFNWAAPGRSAEKAVWEVSLRDEAAAARGMCSAATLIDLVKAFEHIPLETLWARGKEHGFPLWLLRLVLEMCSAARRLVFRGAISEPTATMTAVIAGLVAAIDCMHLMVVNALDRIRREFPRVRTIAYVDDLTLHRAGTEQEVQQDLEAATAQLVGELERDCRLVVSRAKSGVVASSRELIRMLKRGMGRLGIGVMRKTKLLGVDYQPGKGRGGRREVQGKRWGKVMGRRRRVNKLGRRAGPHVVSTGVAPAARYGATVTGPSCSLVKDLGTMAAGAFGPMGGRSVWGRLGVRGADHRASLILAPIKAWLEAVWEGRVEQEELLAAWRYAQRVTGLSKRPHASAHGAARSFIAALTRVGWRSPAVDTVLTREGHMLRIGEVDVVMVMRCAEDDLAVQMGVDSAIGRDINDLLGERGHYRALAGVPPGSVRVSEEGLGRGMHVAGTTPMEEASARIWRGARFQSHDGKIIPWLLPAAMVLKRRLGDPARCTAADSSAAAMVEGGWWTASRLLAEGLTASATCAACMEAVGTYWHRMGECSTTKEVREGKGGCPQWLRRKGRASLWDPLFTRGVPALPRVPALPPERVVRTLVLADKGDALVATGDIYTDGAVRGKWRRIMRGGWGIVALAEGENKVLWRMHGTCHELYPSILRAELSAVLNVLRVALPPLVIHVDNAEVVRGFAQGHGWCTAPGRDGGDLWREVWTRMEDLGGGVRVTKVKAHTSEDDVDDGIITVRDRYGNLQADAEAKRGARLAESLAPVGVAKGELLKAIRWTGWVRRFAAGWKADVEEGDDGGDERGKGRSEEELRPGRVPTGLRHLVWERGLEWTCRRCGRTANTDQKRRVMISSRCLGSAVGRMLARTCGDGAAVSRCCLNRKTDLERRGWKPRAGAEGGEEGSAGARRLFGEEGDDEPSIDTDDSGGAEGEVIETEAGEQVGLGHAGGVMERELGAAAASAAAATACGSASAPASATDGPPSALRWLRSPEWMYPS